jgi:F-type H+-transporting ATPase subunit b
MKDGIIEFTKAMLDNLGYQIFNTIVLALILTYLLYKPVKNFMKNRTDRISKQLSDAELAISNAEELKLFYEDKKASIEKERGEILDTARKIALESENNIINAAKKEAESIKNRALQDIKLEEEKARDSIKSQIIEISMQMAGKYVATNIDEAAQNKLFDEVISGLGDTKWLS